MNLDVAITAQRDFNNAAGRLRRNGVAWFSTALILVSSLGVAFLRELSEFLKFGGDRLERLLLALVLTGLALTIGTLTKRLSRMERMLVKFSDVAASVYRQESMLKTSTEESTLLRNIDLIRRSTPEARIHLQAGLDVLDRMQNLNSVENLRKIEELYHRKKLSVTLQDKSLAFLFLKHVLEVFPGGVWLGVSRLTSKARWTQKRSNEEFSNFRAEMQRRTKSENIQVFRIYYFSDPEDFEGMKHTLAQEDLHGVVVKYILDTQKDDGDPLPDMSLLWERTRPEVLLEKSAIENLTLENMEDKGFKAACGIRFHVVSNEELKEVTVNEPDSDEFTTLLRKFREAWSSPECREWNRDVS